MGVAGVVAELGHVAEHRDGPARLAAAHDGERLERGAHRLGVGVVGVVDDGDAVGALDDLHAPARLRRRGAEQLGDAGDVGGDAAAPGPRRRSRARWRPGARRAPAAATSARAVRASRRRNDARPASSSSTSAARTSASGAGAEGRDRAVRCGSRMPSTSGSSALSTAAVRAASTSSPLAWAICSRLPNSPDVRGADVEHDGDVRRDQPAQEGDVADAAGAVLERREAGLGRAPQGGQRQAELVVERALRRERRADAAEHLREQVLGRGLAAAAGDADGERLGRPGVRAARPAPAAPPAGRARRGTGRRRPAGRRARRRRRRATAAAAWSWPSARSPASATNSEPGRDQPAVDLDVGGDRGGGRRPDDGGAGQARRPRRASSGITRSPRHGLAQHRAVVEGGDDAADLLAGLVALAGDHDDVAGPRLAHGERDGGAPVGLAAARRARRRPSRPGSRAGPRCAGCRWSGPRRRPRAAARAHERPLGAVAVAAAAEHDDDPAAGEPAGGRDAARDTASGVWA